MIRRLQMRSARAIAAAVALGIVMPLAACSDAGENGAANDAGAARGTLAAAIAGAPGLSTLSGALSEAGLAEVFDGPGSYTVLAPSDEAFASLESSDKSLTDPERRAELVAVLRGHILPGHLTLEAIKKAIADKKGPVTIRTLSDETVTFAEDGGALTVAGADGAKAKIDGEALVASNGVVLPIDGLVKSAAAAEAQ